LTHAARPQADPDEELVRLIGRGDRVAFATLVERYLARAGATAARIAGNRSDAEEIVQEAFLRVWLKAPEWQGRSDREDGARFSTWFYRVLVNLCLDRKRKPVHGTLDQAAETVPDPAPSAMQQVETTESGQRVAAAVAKLPERQRTALSLCYYNEVSNIEAAEIMGLSVGAVESLLVRARRTLKAELADLAGDAAA